MAKYIKGVGVPNATTYELFQKIVTGGGVVETKTYDHKGYIAATSGAVTNPSSTWIHSDFIKMDELTGEFGGICPHGSVASVAYYSDTDYGTYLGSLSSHSSGIMALPDGNNPVSTIIDNAPVGSQYVIVSTDGSKYTLTVSTISSGVTSYHSLATKSEINFELTALGLGAGTHTLVVKAKADGYLDSDYSNEVMYTVEEEIPVYSITTNFTNCGWDYQDSDTIAHGAPLYAIFSTVTGYKEPVVTVTMGGVDITADVYTDNEIDIPAVTGDIVVTATATEKWTYTVTLDGAGAYLSNTTKTVEHGDSFVSAISAYTGNQLDSVTVKMGGKDITATAYSEGNINIASVTGNIVITAMTHFVTQEKLATPEIYME